MRILDLQRRLREVGRIRIGEQVATSGGRSRPAKLEVFRLTSRDRAVIAAAAERFGGTAETWDDAPDGQQWQVKTTTAEMAVVVPPGDMAFSQAYEQWTAGGCRVRCDGRWDHLNDKACHCDPTDRACNIHTRLSVMLPDLPGLGVWRLDTSGYYAAVELGGVVDLAAGYAERGQMLPARLRLEQRSVKRVKPDGKTETRRFAVPVLDLDVHPLTLAGGGTPVAIEGGGPRFTPVPQELATPPVAPVGDQVPELGAAGPARRNAAAPIPATGARPRTAAEASGDDLAPPAIPAKKAAPVKKAAAKKAAPPPEPEPEFHDDNRAPTSARDAVQARIDALTQDERQDLGAWWAGQNLPPLRHDDLTDEHVSQVNAAIDAYAPATPDPAARNKKMWAMVAEAWPSDPDEDRDELRRHLIEVVSGQRTASSHDLTDDEWSALFDGLASITDGSHALFLRSNGEWELRKATGGAS